MTVHFENNDIPITMLLDLVEVPHSHSGLHLAEAFTKILEEFGISKKVLISVLKEMYNETHKSIDPQYYAR